MRRRRFFLWVPLRYRYNAHLRTRKRYIMVLSVTVATTIFIELCTIFLDKIHLSLDKRQYFRGKCNNQNKYDTLQSVGLVLLLLRAENRKSPRAVPTWQHNVTNHVTAFLHGGERSEKIQWRTEKIQWRAPLDLALILNICTARQPRPGQGYLRVLFRK